MATSAGTIGLLEPTDFIGHDDSSIVLDGIELRTLYTPDTEALAEFVFLLPAWRALWTAEVVTHVQHNLYTLRGAQARDSLGWAKADDTMIARFGGGTELIFASHHWPTWGHDASLDLLRTQRDTYRYLHDETQRRADRGETMLEVAEQLELCGARAYLVVAWVLRLGQPQRQGHLPALPIDERTCWSCPTGCCTTGRPPTPNRCSSTRPAPAHGSMRSWARRTPQLP